jgi:hypothetical protein
MMMTVCTFRQYDRCRIAYPGHGGRDSVIVHLIDGIYELFRHSYGLRRFNKVNDKPFGAVNRVLVAVPQRIEEDATHIYIATDRDGFMTSGTSSLPPASSKSTFTSGFSAVLRARTLLVRNRSASREKSGLSPCAR